MYVMGVDGGGEERLGSGFGPVWSPDGTKIAFNDRAPSEWSDLYVMNADGTGRLNLTAGSGWTCHMAWPPTWSPDGSRIAFTSGDYEVCVVNVDGTGLAVLAEMGTAPAWAPR